MSNAAGHNLWSKLSLPCEGLGELVANLGRRGRDGVSEGRREEGREGARGQYVLTCVDTSPKLSKSSTLSSKKAKH